MAPASRRARRRLLATSSLLALMAAAASSPAQAQCNTTYSNTTTAGCTNTGTITQLHYTNAFITSSVTNAGTISPGGIVLTNSTLGGDINNGGTITGGISIDAQSTVFGGQFGLAVLSVPTFGGGITNAGSIAPAGDGIIVDQVSLFTGGILNTGTINSPSTTLGRGAAIDIGISFVVPISTFSGNVSNSGVLTAGLTGVLVNNVLLFSGNITNSGTISAGNVDGILVERVSQFAGGITNSNLITAGLNGIAVGTAASPAVSTFTGGIANSGTISALNGDGIQVQGVSQFAGGITNSKLITAGVDGIAVGTLTSLVSTFTGGISNSGTISAPHGAGILVTGDFTRVLFGNGITNTGTINANTAGIQVHFVSVFSGVISNGGAIVLTPTTGPIITPGIGVEGVATFNGGIVNNGSIATPGVSGFGIAVGVSPGAANAVPTFIGGISNTGTISAGASGISIGGANPLTTFSGGIVNTGTITAAVGIQFNNFILAFSGPIANSGNITGTGGTAIDAHRLNNAITINQSAGTITGAILLSAHANTLNVTGGTVNGNMTGLNAGNTLNFALGAGAFTYGSAFGFSGFTQANVNSGTVILDGANSATNIAVNGGTLQVGDAASPGATLTGPVDVLGGTLSGFGTVAGATTVESGATLAPGGGATLGTITVANGPLTFNSGSFYAVQIAPGAGNNSNTVVSGGPGSVVINGGTVVVTPKFGQYASTNYVIVQTSGGVTGTFTKLQVNGNFTGTMTLDYTTIPGEVLLDVTAGTMMMTMPTGASINQQNVLNGINNAMLGGAALPSQFANLANLSNAQLLNALTQLSGENDAGFFQGAFQAGNSFLNLMVNPFLDGRFGNGGGFGAAMGFAAEEPPALPQAALAFASAIPVKAAPMPASFEQRFSAWGAAYGGSGRVTGDPVVGSHDTAARAAAFAAGVDYRLSPDTLVGFALAGGGTSWDLTAGLGGGSSDMFQAGVYGSQRWGAAYLSGAVAYNFHDVTTNRTLTIAGTDMLQARFRANGVGARLEGGYRVATPWLGVTPYAAAQVQSIALPSYGETATAGSNQFALNFGSQTATTTRSELGAWLDRSTRLDSGALLTLYGRAAWAHDFGNSPSASAIFQALPGSNFIVNGATPARDGALVTGAAQVSLAGGWSFLAKFDGEFSSTTSIYSGSGMVKKTW